MRRGRDSVRTGVGREKRRTSASIHTNCFLGEALARCWFHTMRKGKNGPQLAVGILGTSNTRIFRCCSPGNVPTEAEAFPELFFCAAPLPKAVQPVVPCFRSST